jgi:translation initiation factor RLI1
MNVSYKPQKIAPKFEGTVRMLLHAKIRESYIHPQFVADVMKPMLMDAIMDQVRDVPWCGVVCTHGTDSVVMS